MMRQFCIGFIPSFLLLLFVSSSAAGQDYNISIQNWGVKDGLLHREVNALHQDSNGFIWIGTPFGLNRFDGYEFKWWTPVKDQLNVENIYQIKEDKHGYLWLFSYWASNPKIDLFHPLTNEVISFEEQFGSQMDFQMTELSQNALFLNNGHMVLSTVKGGKIILAEREKGLSTIQLEKKESIQLITSTPQNTIWFLQGETTIAETDLEGNILHSFQYPKKIYCDIERILEESPIFLFYEENSDRERTFYSIETSSGQLDKISGQSYEFVNWDMNRQFTGTFFSNPVKKWDLVNYAWVCSREKELLFDLSSYLMEQKITFREILIDHKGRIWFGGNFGLQVIDIKKNKFRNFLTQDILNHSNNHPIRGITEVGKELYVNGEYSHTYKIDLNSYSIQNFIQEEPSVHFIAAEYNDLGEIWIGNRKAVNVYNPKGEKIRSIAIPNDPWSFYFLDKNRVLIGAQGGLFIYYVSEDKLEKFEQALEYKKLDHTFIYFFKKDLNGQLWIATGNGLYTLDVDSGQMSRYAQDEKAPQYLPARDFQHFHIDHQGVFWIATRGNGLIRFDPQNNAYQQYTRSEGLSHNVLYAVYEDESGFLWLPSDYGLIRFEKSTGNSWTYTTQDGIVNNEFNRISHYQSDNGQLYFGSIDGISTFDPKDFWDTDTLVYSPLVITNYVRYNNEDQRLENLTNEVITSKSIILNPKNDFCVLEFSLLEFADVDKINYAYKIDGLQEDWVSLSGGSLRLSNLPYGYYNLKIKGQSSEGKWSDQMIDLQLNVVVPFYQKAWFILALVFLVFGLLGLIAYIRIRMQRRQRIKLEKIIEERTQQISQDKKIIEQQAKDLKELDIAKTRFFNNISHELRTPLTLIIEPLRQLMKATNRQSIRQQLQIPLNNSQRLLDLVNQLLDLSKLENKKMTLDLQRAQIREHLAQVCHSFMPLAQKKNIQLTYWGDPKIPIAQWDISKMERIVYNLLSNAIKFTEAGGLIELKCFYWKKKNQISIECKDTGVGIEHEQLEKIFDRFHQVDDTITRKNEGTGIGLSLIKELSDLMNGTTIVESEPGKGSVFKLFFPIQAVSEDIALPSKATPLIAKPKNEPGELSELKQAKTLLSATQNKVIIVEDNEELRQFIKRCLPEKYETSEADNGLTGLKKIQEELPDLVICDIMMPGMDGYELCHQLKANTLTSHIPVIMLTAKTTLDHKLQGLKIGADAYLTKPFHTEELIIRIDKLIEGRRLLREKFSAPGWITRKKDVNHLSDLDKEFLQKIDRLIESHLSDESFNVELLAQQIHMSRSQLFRKFKAIIGKSPKVYIRECRLHHAMNLVQKQKMNLVELAEHVGFKDERYFSSKFKEYFGLSPLEVSVES